MEQITQWSSNSLLKYSKEEIRTLERKLNFPSIIQSKEASIQSLRKETYEELLTFVTVCSKAYLEICYPNQTGLAAILSEDLIETRPTWKLADFPYLFKFLRQRQDLEALRVAGNQITPQRFFEMVAVYEDHRAQELELFHQRKKGEDLTVSERGQGNSIKALMGKEMERVEEKNEKLRLQGHSQLYNSKSDHTFFERKAVNE